MKRIISIIFVLAIIFSFSSSAFADEYVFNDLQESTSTLQYDVPSQFCVIIPSVIDLNFGHTFQADYVNILDNQVVRVYNFEAADGITLTNQSGNTINVHLTGGNGACFAEFTNSQLTSPYTICGQAEEGFSAAGSYTGTTTFIVQLEAVSP